MNRPSLRCYAEGRAGQWEAICLDFDIAVQGRSFDEVYRSLDEAIGLYLDSLAGFPEADRRRLLRRRAPLAVRLKFLWIVVRALFWRDRENTERHEFVLPATA